MASGPFLAKWADGREAKSLREPYVCADLEVTDLQSQQLLELSSAIGRAGLLTQA